MTGAKKTFDEKHMSGKTVLTSLLSPILTISFAAGAWVWEVRDQLETNLKKLDSIEKTVESIKGKVSKNTQKFKGSAKS